MRISSGRQLMCNPRRISSSATTEFTSPAQRTKRGNCRCNQHLSNRRVCTHRAEWGGSSNRRRHRRRCSSQHRWRRPRSCPRHPTAGGMIGSLRAVTCSVERYVTLTSKWTLTSEGAPEAEKGISEGAVHRGGRSRCRRRHKSQLDRPPLHVVFNVVGNLKYLGCSSRSECLT